MVPQMDEFWVLFANNDFDSNRLNVEKLKYPLAMHIPPTAFGKNEKLRVYDNQFSLSVEIAFLTGKDLNVGHSCRSAEIVDSFYLVISSTNNYHIKEMQKRIVKLSDQDESDAEYYTRWYDKSNIISCELPNSRLDINYYQNILHGAKLGLKYGNFKISQKIEYYHSPIDILKFISSFTPIKKGTLICMGNLFREEFQAQMLHSYDTAHFEISGLIDFKGKVRIVN